MRRISASAAIKRGTAVSSKSSSPKSISTSDGACEKVHSGNLRPVLQIAEILVAAKDFPLSGLPAKSVIFPRGILFSQSHLIRLGLISSPLRQIDSVSV